MKIERYFKLILKKWWIIALFEIIALGATFYYVNAQPSTYTSTATLILNPKNSNPIIPYTNPDTSSADSLADSYNLVLKSESFLSQVQKLLDFDISMDDLRKAFTSKLTPNTLSYYITATSGTPEEAQKIAKAVTTAFLANQTNKTIGTDQANTANTLQTQKDQLAALNTDIANLNKQIKDLQAQTDSQENRDKITALRLELRGLLDSQAQAVLAIGELESKATGTDLTNYALLLNDAKLPVQPDPTNLTRNLVFAFALAMAMSVGVILLINYLDTSVRGEEDLLELTGMAPLAQIPEIELLLPKEGVKSKSRDKNKDKEKDKEEEAVPAETSRNLALHRSDGKLSDLLVTSGFNYSPAAEAYRSLRTNMLFSIQPDKLDKPINPIAKSFLVTSSLPKEGRSVTAANLAIAFAQTGKKVILIDSDLRHPSLHNLFNLPNETGFSDLALSGITKLTKAVHSTSIQNLVVVTSGSALSNPSELLTSTKATNVIKFFKNIADIVIFDSPPVSLVTDAAILANMVDQVVLVVEHKVTERTVVANTVLELNKVGAQIEGVVFNRVKQRKNNKTRSYFNYHASPNKNNGNGNGTETQEKPAEMSNDEGPIKEQIIQPNIN